eukprot:521573_1
MIATLSAIILLHLHVPTTQPSNVTSLLYDATFESFCVGDCTQGHCSTSSSVPAYTHRYTDSEYIYLVGGIHPDNIVRQYNVQTDAFYRKTDLSIPVQGYGQNYVQIGWTAYMLSKEYGT